jgi:hypothetical protein
MRIAELLLEDEPANDVQDMDEIFKGFAEKYGLTILHGMGWPSFNSKGGWFGGGLGIRGGSRTKIDTDILAIEVRIRGFLVAVSKHLEAMMAEGRVVMISKGADRTHSKIVIKPGEAKQALIDNAVDARPPGSNAPTSRGKFPCVAWFIGMPTAMAGLATVGVQLNFNEEVHGGKWPRFMHGFGTMEAKKALRLEKDFLKFDEKERRHEESNPAVKYGRIWVDASPAWLKMARAVTANVAKQIGIPNFTDEKGNLAHMPGWISVKRSPTGINTTRIDMDELEAVIRANLS